jgi:hypothetical protein
VKVKRVDAVLDEKQDVRSPFPVYLYSFEMTRKGDCE